MDPFSEFRLWYGMWLNTDPTEPAAMALSTAGRDGHVSSRIVLLRDYDEKGFVFFTNYTSTKGTQIHENPHASLLFYWPTLSKQVRIEGTIEKTSREQSEKYFHARARENQLGAWASEQSSKIPDREYLLKRFDHYVDKFADREVDVPPHWGGYILTPSWFEFWTAGRHRLNDRVSFRLSGGKWIRETLAP
jgi:pyridoxamine 5'-phosphate oxidase